MAVSTGSGLGEDVITELNDDGVTETLRVVEGRAKFTAAGDDVMVTGIVEEGGGGAGAGPIAESIHALIHPW